MALVLADRVKDSTTSTGTGTITLANSPPAGFQSFAVIGNANTTYYTIAGGAEWEVGIGTYTSSGTTLSRDTVLSSSAGGTTKVDFSAGAKDVFVTYPAERSVYEDAAGNININITGNAATATSATTATNLAGGASGSIPYQSGAGTTTFLASGTGVLVNSAGNPSYSMTPSLTQVTVAGNPTAALEVATKQYVDGLVATGLTYHAAVKYEVPSATGNLNAIYNQPGGPGVGVNATLTNNGTKAAFAPDGPTAQVGERILVYNQTNAFENGVYTVTTVGTPDPGGTNWVLTRATDADSYGLKDPDALGEGDAFFITSGNTGAGETYEVSTQGTITFGTTPINFVQISSAQVYSAGNGLQLTGTVFSLISPVVTSNGGTGLTSFTSGGAVYATSTSALTTGTLPVTSGGTGATTAPDARTNLGGTTVGSNLFTLTNPSAITFPRFNADNTVSALDAASFRAAIGAGTGNGTVTSVDGTGTVNGITLTGTVTSSGSLTLGGTLSGVSLTTQVSGMLPVANGGTGSNALTANNVLLGNGSNPLQVVAPGTSGNVLTSNGTTWTSTAPAAPGGPTLTAVASGSLSDGSTVIINVDGTVSIATIAGGPGSPTVFESASTSSSSAAYDSVTQRVVIAYRDNGNSGFGTAIVGTVSGTSISFGTAVVFESASTDFVSATYNTTAQRIVIAYQDVGNSSFGTAIVGTVSGTSISFGTPVVFYSLDSRTISATYNIAQNVVFIAFRDADNLNIGRAIAGTVSGTSISFPNSATTFNSNSTSHISTAYHTGQQRVVVAYSNGGDSNRGTALVVSFTGTVLSYGTPVVFETTATTNTASTYDASAQRIVIAYTDVGNSSFGTAVVGTVSGTSISFGTPVVFESASTSSVSAAYDSVAVRIVISYTDVGNSSFGTAIVGTVSGTSISFGTATVFESASTNSTTTVYDASAQRIVIAYTDVGNSSFGTALTFAVPVTNLTSENFIGFSNGAYTNGQTATIQIVGSVDDAQSGLTPGQSYFVQPSGALGLSPGVPSVFAGTAVAATRIIVKG